MIFSLLITSAPHSATAGNAFEFARATLAEGHTIFRVFFMGDGAAHADSRRAIAGAGRFPGEHWSELADKHAVDLVVCVGSALQQGVVDTATAARLHTHASVLPGFAVSGLGQLVEASSVSDRVVSFG